MSEIFEQKYDREIDVTSLTSDILDLLDSNDPKFKEIGDVIRISLEMAWRMGNREGYAQAVQDGAGVVRGYHSER